ncbi:MAG: 3-phosphoshikimate 1-carboxyvinyltransferase [Clostridia bacterium]|nr:3-phosphoshikimate 1-carboxyvinyltransferase [Clostridia bacterium]
MNVTITPSQLFGTVNAIPSKSVAHRILICAALSNEKTVVHNLFSSKDILATKACLSALGCDFEEEFVIPGKKKGSGVLNCCESGSTLRFMLPVALALGGEFSFEMAGRLPERPLSPLYELLQAHGCTLSKQGKNPLKVSGKLMPGIFEIAGNISSQFITGLLLALPLLESDSEIRIVGELESKPYVDITRNVQSLFGIQSCFKNNTFYVKGNQRYVSPGEITVEGDWSNAAFWHCADVLSKKQVECIGLNENSVQGDKEIVSITHNLPCTVCAKDIPDLIPIIAAVASVTAGQTIITDAKRLIIKESNRLKTIENVLTALGADITLTEDGMIINGKESLSGGTVDSFNDHRIAMMAAIASIKCKEAITITNAEAVQKSYPHFWNDFKALGGIIKEEL